MRGIAAAAFCCLLLICSLSVPARACTSFCLDTPDGPLLAANLDLTTGDGHVFINRRGIAKEGYFESTRGETMKWVASHGSVTFNLVGRELPWGGINEAGLAMSTMQLNASRCPPPDERPPLSEAYLVQYLLDTCSSVEEAIEAVSLVRLAQHECASHYMVVDENGACATIEFLDGRCVIHTGENLPVRALANAPYAAGIAYMEKGIVPADNPGRSVQRVAGAARKIDSFRPGPGVSPVDYSFGVLTETVVTPRRLWSDWFNEPYTRWNTVFDISRREVHFRTVASPAVKHVTLGSFDLSCEAPLLMLDVNATLEGNIDRSFGPYDHDVNLETFRTFCDLWGVDVSEQNAANLVRFFESFPCAPETPMDRDKLRAFAANYTSAWCSQDAASVATFFAENGSLKINDGSPSVGRTAITAAAQGFMAAFPDMVVVMDGVSVADGHCVYSWTLTGTNTGPGGSGRALRISGYEEWTIGEDGLISASLGHFDEVDYRRQLGAGTANE